MYAPQPDLVDEHFGRRAGKGPDDSGESDPEWASEVRREIEEAIGLPDFWEIEKETVEAMHKDYSGLTNAGYEGYDQKKA